MAISLNDHERRIKGFEGQVNTINSKITSLENRPPAKDWGIVDANGEVTIPSEYMNYNFTVLVANLSNTNGRIKVELYSCNDGSGASNLEVKNSSSQGYTKRRPKFNKSGNRITITENYTGGQWICTYMRVLFYR